VSAIEGDEKKLRDLLWRMREEAAEAWRNVGPGRPRRARRNQALFREVEDVLGPDAWDSLDPATHVVWDETAICRWTQHGPARWPETQKAVPIASLIVQLPCAEDESFVEFVARPDADWNGVTCDACRVRLPTLLREMSAILDDVQEGVMEGYRSDPGTIRAHASYLRHVEPRLTTEQRQRYADQAQRINAKNARRAARRARSAQARRVAP
jgi:hypothetical protein